MNIEGKIKISKDGVNVSSDHPLYLASESRLVAIVAKEAALSYWQTGGMTDAQIVGHIGDNN